MSFQVWCIIFGIIYFSAVCKPHPFDEISTSYVAICDSNNNVIKRKYVFPPIISKFNIWSNNCAITWTDPKLATKVSFADNSGCPCRNETAESGNMDQIKTIRTFRSGSSVRLVNFVRNTITRQITDSIAILIGVFTRLSAFGGHSGHNSHGHRADANPQLIQLKWFTNIGNQGIFI
jgi:hypothetical protein